MKLVAKQPGLWETDDERAIVSYDPTFETECDEPHPVRISLDTLAGFSAWYRKSLTEQGTVRGRYLCYQCRGGETHFYGQWTVRVDGTWTDDVYDTFTEARAALEGVVGKVTLQRQRKPEPTTTEEATGRRTWTKCGHPAERDAFDGCYTCHRPLVPIR